jgi:hypothetical protein
MADPNVVAQTLMRWTFWEHLVGQPILAAAGFQAAFSLDHSNCSALATKPAVAGSGAFPNRGSGELGATG